MTEDLRQILDDMGLASEYKPGMDFYDLAQKTRTKVAPCAKSVIKKNIHTENSFIKIVPLSDIHLGAMSCKEGAFVAFSEFINSDPDIYTILMGDMSETATKMSVGLGVFDEKYQVGTQRRILTEILRPLAGSGKILGGGTGNHEMRISYIDNDNPMEELCYDLDIPYFGYQGYFRVRVNHEPYDIMAFHGTGGGSTKGGRANSAAKPNQIANVDIYLTGHTHDQLYLTDVVYEIGDDDALVAKKRHYVVCGSFLDYFGGYAEMKGLPPMVVGAPMILLGADSHAVHCTM
jgi:hypothetical protein